MAVGNKAGWALALAAAVAIGAAAWWQSARTPEAGIAAIGDDPDTAFGSTPPLMQCHLFANRVFAIGRFR